jgi:hypothetical protein
VRWRLPGSTTHLPGDCLVCYVRHDVYTMRTTASAHQLARCTSCSLIAWDAAAGQQCCPHGSCLDCLDASQHANTPCCRCCFTCCCVQLRGVAETQCGAC